MLEDWFPGFSLELGRRGASSYERIDTPWRLMLLADLAFPATEATRPKDWKSSSAQLRALHAAALEHAAVQRRLLEVVHLVRPFQDLFDPEIEALLPQMRAAC